MTTKNPYPEFLVDEDWNVRNEKHLIWQEGYEAGSKDAKEEKEDNDRLIPSH